MTNERYGGFWRRLGAFIIDKTFVCSLSFNISLLALFAVGLGNDIMTLLQSPPEELSRQIGAVALLCLFLSLLIDMTYFTWFHGVNGQTPGKMLLRLRVIQASGEPVTPGTAFLRWAACLISGLVFWLGFFWIALDSRKQGWHDKIAMTFVVRLEKTSASPLPSRPPPVSLTLPSDEANETDALTDQK
jgi:uncharacterized RDD family membrane protein YckC